VELARAQMDPETFSPTVTPPTFALSYLTERLEVGDETIHPTMKVGLDGRAYLGHLQKHLHADAASLNTNPRKNGLVRQEEWVPVIEAALPRIREKIAALDAAHVQLAAEAKAILGPDAEPVLPLTDGERAEALQAMIAYRSLSREEKNQRSGDPKVARWKLEFDPLIWGGSPAEQQGVRDGTKKLIARDPRQQRQLQTIGAVAESLGGVKTDLQRAEKAAIASADRRLLVAKGIVPKAVQDMTGKEKSDLISQIGIGAYERRLVGLE
jgi:hypothetical protein